MLCIYSRLDKTAPHVFTYKDGALFSDMDASKWLVLKTDAKVCTCVVAEDMDALRSALNSQPTAHHVAERDSRGNVQVGRTVEETRKIRVSGRVNARIFWSSPGEVQLIVETGAVVHFHAHRTDTRLIANIRDRARLVVVGRLAGVLPTLDATSQIDVSRLTCTSEMRVGFRGKLVAPTPVETSRQRYVRESISFPHSSTECRPVDDDTPVEHQCKTCYERVSNAVFSPCGHVYMCLVCAERHRSVSETNFCCPLCREPIMGVTKDCL